MTRTWPRVAALITLSASAVLGTAAPAQATPVRQIDGAADFQEDPGGPCPAAPRGFRDYPPLVLRGSLDGCWYTDVQSVKTTPSGVYRERGRELFVGRLDGRAAGRFTTTYQFEAKFAPDGSELHGRCQHPLVPGSGTGGFAGAVGRVDFKDIIGEQVTYVYRGHLAFR